MRSKKEIEQELEYSEGSLQHHNKTAELHTLEIQPLEEKIRLLKWVLGGEDKDE